MVRTNDLAKTAHRLAAMIDHTLLKPEATEDDIIKLCEEGRAYHVWSVCLNPSRVAIAKKLLAGSGVRICSVIAFPFGASAPEVKAFEAEKAITDGADEIDVVTNIGALRTGGYGLIEQEMRAVVAAARSQRKDVIVKFILECCYLPDEDKVRASKLAVEVGADFVKTSTGFGAYGATAHDVHLLRSAVGENFGVKAAGGIRFFEDAMAMISAGANRIGTSSAARILSNH